MGVIEQLAGFAETLSILGCEPIGEHERVVNKAEE